MGFHIAQSNMTKNWKINHNWNDFCENSNKSWITFV